MKTQNPLIGRSAQKFANSIFSTWKGINVVRSKPLEVSNPRSPGQISQRNRFASAVFLARLSLNTVKLGLRGLAIRKSEYNVFIQQNIDLFPTSGAGLPLANVEALIYSKGSLSPINATLSQFGGADVQSTWVNSNRPFQTPLDKVLFGLLWGDGFEVQGYTEVTRDVLATAEVYNNPNLPLPSGKFSMGLVMFAYNDDSTSDSDIQETNL
jgi:hypothetical protein